MYPDRVLREMGEVVTLGMYKPLGQAKLTSENEQTVRLMIKCGYREAMLGGGDV